MKYLLLLLLCVGCGGYYSLNQPLMRGENPVTITVAPIPGDVDGMLRTALIDALSSSGSFLYTGGRAQYELTVKILSNTKDKIGYKYDQKPITGAIINRLIPNEGRRAVEVEATLTERSTKKKIKGPIRISGSADYDYVNSNSYDNLIVDPASGNKQSVLAYSLGQLGSEEEASNTAQNPAFRIVAKKTANYLRLTLIE
jgi:hypothetical protein